MIKIKNMYYTKEIEYYFRNTQDFTLIKHPKAHIYYLIEDAYREMKKTGKRQNFIITGDSGSGKTENSRFILEYLTGSKDDEICRNIMESNSVLEAFGNAKTVINDNSSRFAKFIEIKYSEEGKILYAFIKCYLLEKYRVVQVQEGEENFKIFYQLVLGINEEERKKYKIKSLDYYKYLRNEKYEENNKNKKYKEDFPIIKQYLKNLEFSVDEIDNIFKILSGILYLGNIEFIEKNNQEKLDITDKTKDDLQNASEFLGLDIEVLIKILTCKYKRSINVYENYDKETAESTRDSIAEELYSKLFKYILDKINIKIEKNKNNNNININDNKYEISILDIFGFENFVKNTFEQLCINYANERLQQYFNNEIFKLELKLYQEEKIDYDKIEYTDNTKVVDFIDRRKSSIFLFLKNVVNNRAIKYKDEQFLNDIYNEFFWKICKKNKNALRPIETTDILEYHKNDKNSLYIRHYAGTVKYNIKDMVKKNVSKSNNDIIEAFKNFSKNELIKYLYKNEIIEESDKYTGKTITENFRDELNILFRIFDDSNNRYIKCIKPNNEKKENNFV
jgi:myosin-7